ncbi:MAG: hypothetical protein CL679_08915 [Bermanella sp.]|nr:hypothetical protein [Bermanella sp.]
MLHLLFLLCGLSLLESAGSPMVKVAIADGLLCQIFVIPSLRPLCQLVWLVFWCFFAHNARP